MALGSVAVVGGALREGEAVLGAFVAYTIMASTCVVVLTEDGSYVERAKD